MDANFENRTKTKMELKVSESVCNNPLIVEQIFVNLPLSVLHKCARVCKLWNSIVNKVKRRRQRIFWTYLDNLLSIKPIIRPTVDVGVHLRRILSNARSEPKLVLMFICNGIERMFKDSGHCDFARWLIGDNISTDSDDSRGSLKDDKSLACKKDLEKCEPISDENQAKHSTKRALWTPVMDILASQLPRDCQIISVFVKAIVGSFEDSSEPILAWGAGLTAVFYPTISGVEMFSFTCVETLASCECGNTDVDGREIYITGLPTDKNIKCILLFSEFNMLSQSILHRIQEDYLKNQKCGITLGGAGVRRVMSSRYYYDEEVVQKSGPEIATGLAFAGENFHSASVMLQIECYREHDKILKLLEKLKACNFPEENCVAFLFANVSADKLYGFEDRMEGIMTFHEIFPKVPLFGPFGDLLFWMEHLPNTEDGYDLNSFETADSNVHSVFVLLCFGKR